MAELKNFTASATSLFAYLEKQRQNEKTVKTFEIAATFGAIIFFAIFAIKPAVVTIIGLVGEIDAKKTVIAKLSNKINNIVQAQDIFSQVQERYQIIDDALPSRPRYGQAATQYQMIGQNSGIDSSKLEFGIANGTPLTPTSSDAPISVSVPIQDQTDFANVINFINQINQNRRLIQINSISMGTKDLSSQPLQSADSASQSGKISFSVGTKMLYWPQTTNK